MKISSRLSRVKPSATMAMNAKAQELRAQGESIISLAVGEPDFPTPEHVVQAAKQALDDGFTRYTPVPGIPELREAVAGYYARFYGVETTADQAIVSNGGKHVLYNIFQALLDPGDEVLVPAPYWVSYPAMVQLAEAEPVVVPTTAEDHFKATVEELDKAATPRTRMLIMNTPSNPTGCIYTQPELDAIAEWAVTKGIVVVSDEVYDQLVYAPAEVSSLTRWWEKHPEHFVIVGALSKTFCMTGWRVGYALGDADLVKALSKIQGQSTSCICSIAQKAALAAFTGPWDSVEIMRESLSRRRDMVMDVIAAWPDVYCPRPDGAFYVFPRVSASLTGDTPDSTSLCAKILEEAKVALVPGAAFGDDECIRISYALDEETLTRALGAVGDILARQAG
jgi:aspartate aminotransferase